MADVEPDINKIGAYAIVELLKTTSRSVLMVLKTVLLAPIWPAKWVWRSSGWEFRRRPTVTLTSGGADSTVISDNVLWQLTNVLAYRNGEKTFVIDGPLCPTHLSPLWFALQTEKGSGEHQPVADHHFIDSLEDPPKIRRVMYCPDDKEHFAPNNSLNVDDMREMAESRLRGLFNRNRLLK